jgi:alginate O-acetyltransferase complex protein AlgI
MLFNSFDFLVFFPLVVLIHFLLPYRFRWLHLLLASCIFYMFLVPVYIIVIVLMICIDYRAGLSIQNANGNKRKFFLGLSIFANISLLCFFKYHDFFLEISNPILPVNTFLLQKILLPVGLSFHTFQAMSYTIEVYRGHQQAEKHFGIYALYVLFFPQLVAGPIERPQNLMHQFYEKHIFNPENVVSGLKRICWGLIKKVVIADRLAALIQPVFEEPERYPPITLALAVFFFSFQIFCDFSGYSDIAIGTARILGFNLMENFKRPYHAASIADFWKRWHISLSTWFRDYVYIPLGGSKVSNFRWYMNLIVVFILSGIWHGASAGFLVWGFLNGIYYITEKFSKNSREDIYQFAGLYKQPRLLRFLQTGAVFFLISIAWVFFRAANLQQAGYILSKLPLSFFDLFSFIKHKELVFGLEMSTRLDLVFCLILIILLEVVHYFQRRIDFSVLIQKQPIYIRWAIYYAGVFCIAFLGVYDHRNFIYFQF